MMFSDRHDSGHRLAALLFHHLGRGAIVLGLPRGGVVVAHEMAHALQAPLDVWVVRKIGSPLQPELAIGAISSVSSPSPICGRSKRLRGPAELAIVPGATHLFEEPA